jgi:hypothetical protein
MQNAECKMQNEEGMICSTNYLVRFSRSCSSDMIRRTVLLLVVLGFASPLFAEELPADTQTDTRVLPASDDTHPLYTTDANWVGNLVVAAAGLFLAALVIGPIVRAEAPDAVPVAMSHEENPAADRH